MCGCLSNIINELGSKLETRGPWRRRCSCLVMCSPIDSAKMMDYEKLLDYLKMMDYPKMVGCRLILHHPKSI